MPARRYLGVDGGGTKTAFVLIDEHAQVVAETTGPSCYYFTAGIDLVERVLSDGIREITRQAGIGVSQIEQAFFALPGYGEASADIRELDTIPSRILSHERYSCGNDMIAGWAGSLNAEDGINVVAGTGSIAYGEWNGVGRRAGGWGEIFGDEGSGYWTAIRGLNAFSRMVDGRAEQGPLRHAIREAVSAKSDLDVIGIVIDAWAGKRDRVAALSRAVTAAAADGDSVAREIIERAGQELAALAGAVRSSIPIPASVPVTVSYSGGMFADPGLLDAFTRALGAGWTLQAPRFGPGIGAALYAMKQANARPVPTPAVDAN